MALIYLSHPPENCQKDLWFCFRDQELLIYHDKDSDPFQLIPKSLPTSLVIKQQRFLGVWDDSACYVAQCESDSVAPDGMVFANLRILYSRLGDVVWSLAGQIFHLGYWYTTHQYCGRCGGLLQDRKEERARNCPDCGLVVYPRISPAIIVAITRGDKILLAQAQRFPGTMHSVLAGFVEPGESLEACVRREVKEEAGIDIDNIRYFGSQPWPFPNALMVGFTADYVGGDLIIDKNELVHADWYPFNQLPKVPGPPSIASQLIAHFIQQQKER